MWATGESPARSGSHWANGTVSPGLVCTPEWGSTPLCPIPGPEVAETSLPVCPLLSRGHVWLLKVLRLTWPPRLRRRARENACQPTPATLARLRPPPRMPAGRRGTGESTATLFPPWASRRDGRCRGPAGPAEAATLPDAIPLRPARPRRRRRARPVPELTRCPTAAPVTAEQAGQRLPRLVLGFGSEPRQLQERARLAFEMSQIEPQDAEEGLPAVGVALELVVPVILVGEPAMNHAHDAHPAAASLDDPFRRDRPRFFHRLGT